MRLEDPWAPMGTAGRLEQAQAPTWPHTPRHPLPLSEASRAFLRLPALCPSSYTACFRAPVAGPWVPQDVEYFSDVSWRTLSGSMLTLAVWLWGPLWVGRCSHFHASTASTIHNGCTSSLSIFLFFWDLMITSFLFA